MIIEWGTRSEEHSSEWGGRLYDIMPDESRAGTMCGSFDSRAAWVGGQLRGGEHRHTVWAAVVGNTHAIYRRDDEGRNGSGW
jgi:hypothetical protein